MNIFKFGGASVNSAAGIRNVAAILQRYEDRPLIVVISAMGKTTNALERVLNFFMQNDPLALIDQFKEIEDYHYRIITELFEDNTHPVYGEADSLFNQLRGYIRKGHLYSQERPGYDFEYDQIVSYGELLSSCILHHFLLDSGKRSLLHDVRELIRTDELYRDARIDWQTTESLIRQRFCNGDQELCKPGTINVTQGFLGGDSHKNTTTLGREGSDFSAAIFAYSLKIKDMVIWKDVPGVMNADPKWMPEAVKLETLSYREAIELAYYGASVIHPKTIKPLENANIRLHVRSFMDPELQGTCIDNLKEWKIPVPIYIRKTDQVLISLSTRDFSFVLEENLSEIFSIIAQYRVKVNVMQNSAISFSFCVNQDPLKVKPLIGFLAKDYEVRYNENLELFTVRHYTEAAIRQILQGKAVIMEVRSRNTCQMVVR